MTGEKRLQEHYEDAWFTLLMAEVAAAQGEEALREMEALERDPAARIPGAVSRRCEAVIHRACSARRARRAGRALVRVLNRAAVAAAAVVVLLSAALAASPALRARTVTAVHRVFDTHTDFYLPPAEQSPPARAALDVGWLPEDSALTSCESTLLGEYLEFRRSGGGTFSISTFRGGEGSKLQLDTESAQVIHTDVHGKEATLVYKDGHVMLLWADAGLTSFVLVQGSGISRQEALNIAGGITLRADG